MPEPKLLIDASEEHVRVLTISNPDKRNALHPSILLEMAKRLREFDEEDVRCVVIRGEGDQAFSSGYDIDEIPPSANHGRKYVRSHPLIIAFDALEHMRAPAIAMLNGHAFGAGCELAAACDIRIAREGIKMGMPPARLGIVYSHLGVQKFVDLIGVGYAKEMFYTARHFEVDFAERIGLVNHVLPAERLAEYTMEMAANIAANSPLSVQGHRSIFRMMFKTKHLPEQAYQETLALRAMSLESEDAHEGRRAFAERRKPRFKGR